MIIAAMVASRKAPLLYTLYPSLTKNKKFDVYVPSKSGRVKKVSFGDSRYEDYTIHKDKVRRDHYRTRHAGDKLDDPTRAGFWSWYALWGRSVILQVAFKSAVSRARRLGYTQRLLKV